MKAIYFPQQKVLVFVAESHADDQVMMVSAGLSERQGKLAVEPIPFTKFFGTDPRSLPERAQPDEVPKMHGVKYADGIVVSADDLMGGPAQAGPGDVEPHPHGAIIPRHVEGVRGALYRYHDLILSGKVNASQLGQAARRFVHSEFVAALVKLSPTPADDVILELLRALVPPPEEPAK